jgi:hypothetical protein
VKAIVFNRNNFKRKFSLHRVGVLEKKPVSV